MTEEATGQNPSPDVGEAVNEEEMPAGNEAETNENGSKIAEIASNAPPPPPLPVNLQKMEAKIATSNPPEPQSIAAENEAPTSTPPPLVPPAPPQINPDGTSPEIAKISSFAPPPPPPPPPPAAKAVNSTNPVPKLPPSLKNKAPEITSASRSEMMQEIRQKGGRKALKPVSTAVCVVEPSLLLGLVAPRPTPSLSKLSDPGNPGTKSGKLTLMNNGDVLIMAVVNSDNPQLAREIASMLKSIEEKLNNSPFLMSSQAPFQSLQLTLNKDNETTNIKFQNPQKGSGNNANVQPFSVPTNAAESPVERPTLISNLISEIASFDKSKLRRAENPVIDETNDQGAAAIFCGGLELGAD